MTKRQIIRKKTSDEIVNDESIKKIDNLGDGMYKIEGEGINDEVSLDEGEAETISTQLRQDQSDVKSSDGGIPSAADINDDPRFNRTPLERNYGSNFSDIQFANPDFVGYWASAAHIPKFLNWGYIYAEPRDVKDFKRRFAENTPGEGLSPDGKICIHGLTLLIATKEIAKAKHDDAYKERVSANQIQGSMSQLEMSRRGLALS